MNLRAGVLFVATFLLACPRPPSAGASPDASAPLEDPADDAGWTLTPHRLQAWLAWHGALRKTDAGRLAISARARLELNLAVDAGLSLSEIDRIEDAVSAFVTERNVERLSGSLAITQFKGALSELSAEQRVRAEAAFSDVSAKSAPSPLPALEVRFGPATVKVLLAHEAEVTRTWDALLEAR